jgi:hypothetical protein
LKKLLFFTAFALLTASVSAQTGHEIIMPDSIGWNVLNEGRALSFKVRTTAPEDLRYFSLENADKLPIQFDSTLEILTWKPSYDLVNRVEQKKDFFDNFPGPVEGWQTCRKAVTFTVNHVNRAPLLKRFRFSMSSNHPAIVTRYPYEYVSDPDGDPFVFKIIQTQMPEGSNLSSQGQFTWAPSRSQFNALKNNPQQLSLLFRINPTRLKQKAKFELRKHNLILPP